MTDLHMFIELHLIHQLTFPLCSFVATVTSLDKNLGQSLIQLNELGPEFRVTKFMKRGNEKFKSFLMILTSGLWSVFNCTTVAVKEFMCVGVALIGELMFTKLDVYKN